MPKCGKMRRIALGKPVQEMLSWALQMQAGICAKNFEVREKIYLTVEQLGMTIAKAEKIVFGGETLDM